MTHFLFIIGLLSLFYPLTLLYRVQDWEIQQRLKGKSVLLGFLIIPVGMVSFLLGVSIVLMAGEVARNRMEFQILPCIPYLSIVLGIIMMGYCAIVFGRAFYMAMKKKYFRREAWIGSGIILGAAMIALVGYHFIRFGVHCLKFGLFS